MDSAANGKFVLDILRAIETRDFDHVARSYHPDVEFRWPPGLPYGGCFKGSSVAQMNQAFAATWLPLQPTADSRRMDPRLVAAGCNGTVVIRYMWGGEDRTGNSFRTETLAHYEVRDGLLAGAQMFHFDLQGLIAFLKRAGALSD